MTTRTRPASRTHAARFLCAALLVCALLAAGSCRRKPAPPKEPRHRVFIIGLDGLDWTRLNALFAKGKLPNLKKLMDASAYGGIQTSDLFYLSPVVWTSIATGVEPRTHDIRDFTRFEDGQRVPYSAPDMKAPPLWEILARDRRKSLVLGWLITRYSAADFSVILSDRLAQDCVADPDNLHPPGFKLTRAFDVCAREYTLDDIRPVLDISRNEYNTYTNEERGRIKTYGAMLKREDFYVAAGLEMLKRKLDFDLFALYLRMPDGAGHLATRYRDSLKPYKSMSFVAKALNAQDTGYEYSDRQVGELLPYITKNDYVIVISDHGFADEAIPDQGPVYPGPFFHHELLLQLLGFVTYMNDCNKALDESKTTLYREGLKDPAAYKLMLSFDGFEYYAPPPGRGAEVIREFLAAASRVKTSDGRLLISNLGALNRDKPWERGAMTVLKFNTLKAGDILQVGDQRQHINQFLRVRPSALFHRYPGVFMIKGPGINPGHSARTFNYYDVAPTVLYALGQPVPKHMHGRVMDRIFTRAFLATHPPAAGPAMKRKPIDKNKIADKKNSDQKALNELKSLGYIE